MTAERYESQLLSSSVTALQEGYGGEVTAHLGGISSDRWTFIMLPQIPQHLRPFQSPTCGTGMLCKHLPAEGRVHIDTDLNISGGDVSKTLDRRNILKGRCAASPVV